MTPGRMKPPCNGLHCKCMDPGCPEPHPGDHTCPYEPDAAPASTPDTVERWRPDAADSEAIARAGRVVYEYLRNVMEPALGQLAESLGQLAQGLGQIGGAADQSMPDTSEPYFLDLIVRIDDVTAAQR
ncbi:MAG: hypothetical protein ACRDQH_06645 [Pseudonocardiaceae bacterium]